MIRTNGIDMAVHEAGPSGRPTVVLCHGFPELAFSWRHQVEALAKAGYHVLAPDMRGYGLSGRPDPVTAYDIHHLTGDLVGLLDAYGLKSAVFAGHDWGGIVTWTMPRLHPDRVAGVIGVNTPHGRRAPADPIALMRAAYGDRMYIVHFQTPGEADLILNADPGKTLRFFFRRTGITLAQYDSRPKEHRKLSLVDAIAGGQEQVWPGQVLLSDAELGYYLSRFAKTGFTGGINWYRNWTRNWETTKDLSDNIPHPALMVMAENDIVLRPSLADGMEAFVPKVEKHLIKDCGHWTQAEKPEELNRVMIDWLRRNFP